MSKLSPIAIISIGLAIAIAALASGYFLQIAPNQTETESLIANAEKLEQAANQLGAAQKRVKKALEMRQQKIDDWKQITDRKTPPPSIIDLSKDGWHLAIDARAFRNKVQSAINAQMKAGGVEVINGPAVEMPPDSPNGILAGYFNFPPLAYPVVMFDFGAVQVRGTYSQIMNHVRSWSAMPNYLAVTDGLQLTGTTPVFTATYNLSIVGFIRGSKFFPNVPEGGA